MIGVNTSIGITAHAQTSRTMTEIAEEKLRTSPHTRIRNLTCECFPGGLLLRGRVVSFYEKQMAQETLRELMGGVLLFNEIDVVS